MDTKKYTRTKVMNQWSWKQKIIEDFNRGRKILVDRLSESEKQRSELEKKIKSEKEMNLKNEEKEKERMKN